MVRSVFFILFFTLHSSLFTFAQVEAVDKDIVTLQIPHYDKDGKAVTGTLECNKSIAKDLQEIFAELYKAKYRIESMRPASEYGGDDDKMMEANNTSCYNYRVMTGSKNKLSKHALGLAIDINPLYNPYVKGNIVKPEAGRKYAKNPQIKKGDLIYRLFKKHGFKWGGEWRTLKDYQHFEK
jgi:hypothetical protein